MTANDLNNELARAMGLPSVGLISIRLEVADGKWPTVRALYEMHALSDTAKQTLGAFAPDGIAHLELSTSPK